MRSLLASRAKQLILSHMKRVLRSAPVAMVLGAVIWAYMALCGRTIRWRVEGLETAKDTWTRPNGLIVAAWHSTILTLPTGWTKFMRKWPERSAPSAMLISLSPDAEPVSRAIRHLGLEGIRGSSFHKRKSKDKGGGAAIAEASKLLRSGGAVCITPDGPRGPRQRAGLGPIVLARRANVPILPYALATAPSKRLSTWDRFQIPIPFARGAIVFGSPLTLAKSGTPETMRRELETALNIATRRAEALCGAPHIDPETPADTKADAA
ncbi:MAG: lysophospholipid acyltransferase family protein [Pseudomonadota bacterium]